MITKGLFFDWDGTLVDSFEANLLAYQKAFIKIDYSLSREKYHSVYGQNICSFSRDFIPNISDDELALIIEIKQREYLRLYSMIKRNEPLIDFALSMMNTGMKLALVTNASKKNVQPLLSYLGLESIFDCCIFAEDVNDFKPHPEGYLKALSHLNLDCQEVITFEDSPCGITAASAANIDVIKVEM